MASNQQMERIMRYDDMIRRQAGLAVRPYRADGYVNMMTRYGTSRDISEQYRFVPEQAVPDELLTMYYEGNGLFAKIIDMPAEEALKNGFHLNGIADHKIEDFFSEALDELDWEETAMTAIKWARLYGGAIAVLLVNDGRGLEEPLDWKNIRSIDDIRVYDRSLIQADTSTMFNYSPEDPFRTRGSRLGMPEYYHVFSRYGNFTVHDSRCLVFRNGILPEGATNTEYQLWGTPEYVRIHKAIRDAEIAHGSAPKLLDRSVQPVYKMKDLQQLLTTEDGEDQVLQRLRVIDIARGLLNSLVIDKDGEEYDFKTFTFSGVSNVISAACNMLSALSNIPQTILFGQPVGGLSTTDDTAMENYYNFVQRIQKRQLRSNLRYLLSIIFQAGVSTGEVDEVPKIKVEFNPLWSLSDVERADLEQKKANTQNTKARTAQIYVDMQAMDSSEVRKSLADSDEFDVEEILDGTSDDDLFPLDLTPDNPGVEENGNAPDAAPTATKLPEDMSVEELAQAGHSDSARIDAAGDTNQSVGVLVIKDGQILCGVRGDTKDTGMVCGPGGHVKEGETYEQAAVRETEEEFGIRPKELLQIGYGPVEADTGAAPALFLCTDYDGSLATDDNEMMFARFMDMDRLFELIESGVAFPPFADSLKVLLNELSGNGGKMQNRNKTLDKYTQKVIIKLPHPQHWDGGPGSGNHEHKGVPGQVGGSAPGTGSVSPEGENVPCTGFASSSKLRIHAAKHGPEFGITSKKEYQQRGIDFLKQPCGGDVLGYSTSDGMVVRFNRVTTEYATGFPGSRLCTYMKAKCHKKTFEERPENAMQYYLNNKAEDLGE